MSLSRIAATGSAFDLQHSSIGRTNKADKIFALEYVMSIIAWIVFGVTAGFVASLIEDIRGAGFMSDIFSDWSPRSSLDWSRT